MAFMQPTVYQGNFVKFEANDGSTQYVDKAYAGDIPEDATDREELLNQWAAYTSAPGYMDRTETTVLPTEREAWQHLIDNFPESFTFYFDETTIHRRCESVECATLLQETIQTIEGASLERDGNFIYVVLVSEEDRIEWNENHPIVKGNKELQDSGFDVKETC